jgi:arsenate reductase
MACITAQGNTMMTKIYHNPRCSKSRQTLQLLKEHGIEPEIIEYLKHPPSTDELQKILTLLGIKARDLMRHNETPYKDMQLNDPSLDEATLVTAMHEHPILIERPIVTNGNKAAIGRPPENILGIL